MNKITNNDYEKLCKELASKYWKKEITMQEYDSILDSYEIIPFEINCNNEEIKTLINNNCSTETVEENRIIYRGSIDKSIMYDLSQKYKDLYCEYYQIILCSDADKCILTYCEGDFIAEVYNTIEDYSKGIERTKQFIEEM